MEKAEHKLGDIAETLMVTLACRVVDAQSKHSILQDSRAVEISGKVDYDLNRFVGLRNNIASVCVRAKYMDDICRKFITKHPDGTIISLASGLDTRFLRIDNGRITFYDIDLPEVIEIRKSLIPESERNPYLGNDVLENEWVQKLEHLKEKPVLLIAEGLMIYLKEEEVKSIVQTFHQNLTHPDNEMVFDVCSPTIQKNSEKHEALRKTNARLQWGIPMKEVNKIEQWGKGIKLLSKYHYSGQLVRGLGFLNLKRLLPPENKGYAVLWFKMHAS